MFAVSGWNLPPGPKTQIDESAKKPKQHKKKTAKSASDTNAVPLSNKRSFGAAADTSPAALEKPAPKQTKAGKNTVVTADNVLVLYEKVIEGKAAKRSRDREKKKEKKEKAEREQGGKGMKDAEEAEGSKGTTKAEGKKKKRNKPHDEESFEVATSDAPPAASGPPKKKKKQDRGSAASAPTSTATPAVAPPPVSTALSSIPALTPLQQKMRAKLSSARFRHINEILYTTPSASSHSLFASQPEMYTEYHTGFRRQVEVWPENPVDIFIRTLQDRSKIKFERGHNRKWYSSEKGLLPLPRDREDGFCTVADLGCGDAKIAGTINYQKPRGKGKVKVLSFDLQASTPDVTVADIAHLPLEAESVDIAIFCLALMGTNFLEFIEEAFRILRWRGELWVAEIKSRFNRPISTKGQVIGGKKKKDEDEDDGESIEPDGKKLDTETFKPFIEALARRGFVLRGQVDDGNKMFVRMEFVKMPERERRMKDEDEDAEESKGGETWKAKEKKKKSRFLNDEVKEDKILKPCVYKLR